MDGATGRIYQRGFHALALCEDCNNKTGAWYGTEYARWCQWGHTFMDAMRENPPPLVPAFNGFPLRIAKQVLVTMIASSGPTLTDRRPDLRDLCLNREAPCETPVRLATYLCNSATGRPQESPTQLTRTAAYTAW